MPDGTYLIPSGAGARLRASGSHWRRELPGVSVIPATYEQDQFRVNLDHQLTPSNRLSGKFFFSNQPSLDPLANSDALTPPRARGHDQQRTFSLTDTTFRVRRIVNEFRAGFFRNRNDSVPCAYFTNAEFGIENPLAAALPDLAPIDDPTATATSAAALRFGTPPDGTRIFDRQNTFTVATRCLNQRAALPPGRRRVRRHQLNGDLQETPEPPKQFRSWFDFLTVGFRNPADGNRARQISDTCDQLRRDDAGLRMSDWNWFVADDWKMLAPDIQPRRPARVLRFSFRGQRLLRVYDYPAASRPATAGRIRLRVQLQPGHRARRGRARLPRRQQDIFPATTTT